MTDQNDHTPNEAVRTHIDSPATEVNSSMSRRHFLQLLGFATVTGGVLAGGIALGSQLQQNATASLMAEEIPQEIQYSEVPPTPAHPPTPDQLRFFTLQEALVIDALCGRILPGTLEDPGAQEATVVVYIDNLLSWGDGFAEATYRMAPFAYVYEGDEPPMSISDYDVIPIKASEIDRYGYQSQLNPREVYRSAIVAIETYVRREFEEVSFVDLTAEQQNGIVQAMLNGEMDTFQHFTSTSFFHVLRRHVAEGMFSDPAYGGNRDMVGWKLIGYPGAQRIYSPEEIRTVQPLRPPQSLADMNHFHPGQDANKHVHLPVSGSDVDNLVHPHKNQQGSKK